MKIKLITISLAFLLVTSVFAGATIDYITARSESGDTIKIEWKSNTESNLSHYVIKRSPVNRDSYTERGKITAKGNNQVYEFTDDASYKTTDVIFSYKLVSIDKNGNVSGESSPVSVRSNISDVKRTWGSIKAMFR